MKLQKTFLVLRTDLTLWDMAMFQLLKATFRKTVLLKSSGWSSGVIIIIIIAFYLQNW